MTLKNKDFLLKESKVFCMFPWIHLNVTPKGDIYPCCSNDYSNSFGNVKENSLSSTFNDEKMKQLRINMLSEEKSDICKFCYNHEQSSPYSFRRYSLDNWGKNFDELVPQTLDDGTVSTFKMKYLDIRFSNICNFKCRTCGSEFSSQWAAEEKSNFNNSLPIIIHADDNKGNLLDEVLTHIDSIDLAYFGGGEPLITEEHYIILEEMIRRGRTDITLRYNTNASNLKYKNYDILNLWKHFKKVDISCSIDHYGERAEYIRHGTDWGKVESNLLMFRKLDYLGFQINTVFSIFNYLTLTEFYSYLQDKNILRPDDYYNSLYLAVNPTYYSAKSLPKILKDQAKQKAEQFIKNKTNGITLNNLIKDAINFADESNTWEENKQTFLMHTNSTDKIRNENFVKIFPELKLLTD